MIQSILITTDAIDECALASGRKISGRAGGLVTFQGIVRDKEGGDKIEGIEYEAFHAMAEHQFRKILSEVEQRWPIEAAHIIHRIGFVPAGVASLWVEVSGAHRREAFEACEYMIDQMKVRVPILEASEVEVISKFPKWVWLGGWALAFVAGIVNVIGLMHVHRQAITHLTGTTTMLSEAIAQLDWAMTLHFAGLIASFLVGTVISGFLIEDTALKLSRPYGVALFLESAMLAAAAMWFVHGGDSGIYLASCACGLQNALVTTFSGAVIRTTHLSGMFTDLGIFLGHALRGRAVNMMRMKLSFLVISAFFTGGIAGAIAFKAIGYHTLLIPSGLTGFAALGFGLNHLRERRRAGAEA